VVERGQESKVAGVEGVADMGHELGAKGRSRLVSRLVSALRRVKGEGLME
jgi:hypothetical protein